MAAEPNDDVILAYRPSQIKALVRASWWKGCWSGFSLGVWSAIGGGAVRHPPRAIRSLAVLTVGRGGQPGCSGQGEHGVGLRTVPARRRGLQFRSFEMAKEPTDDRATLLDDGAAAETKETTASFIVSVTFLPVFICIRAYVFGKMWGWYLVDRLGPVPAFPVLFGFVLCMIVAITGPAHTLGKKPLIRSIAEAVILWSFFLWLGWLGTKV
jgi:hypothetical protein